MSPSKAQQHTSVYFEEHSNASVRFDELAPPALLNPPLVLSLGNLKNGGAVDATATTIASTKYTQYAALKRLPQDPRCARQEDQAQSYQEDIYQSCKR
jgi:hypothetical protein